MSWHRESKRHSLASRGIRTTQRIAILSRLNRNPVQNKDVATIRQFRERFLRELYATEKSPFGAPESYRPFFGQFSEMDEHYVPGDVFYKVGHRMIPYDLSGHSYLSRVRGDTDKDKLHDLIYSSDPAVVREVRELDRDIIGFMARNQGFKYRIVKDKEGDERLITWTTEFRKENPKLFKDLVIKVRNE